MQTKDKPFKIFLILGLTAFCSICYELLVAQAMSLTFGGTVGAYTLTIGIFLFAMGLGSLAADRVGLSLFDVELLVAAVGLAAPVVILYFSSMPNLSPVQVLAAKLVSNLMLVFLGVLTGLEIPIAFRFLPDDRDRTRAIAIDYVGSFAAGLIFAIFMFPVLGLPLSILVVALLNIGIAGLILFLSIERAPLAKKLIAIALAAIVFALTISHALFAQKLSEFLVSSR
jgi:spermidine synthase